MPRFPLLLPVCLIVCTTWWFSLSASAWWTGQTLGATLLLGGLCLLGLKRHGLALCLLSTSIGACGGQAIRAHLGPMAGYYRPSCQRPACVEVRADGYVEKVVSIRPRVQRYIMRAEVDSRAAPCVVSRVMVIEPLPRVPAVAGERRVVTGSIRRPIWSTLSGEFSEGAYLRSIGCPLVIERARGADLGGSPASVAWLHALRQAAIGRLRAHLPSDVAPVVIALVIGDGSMIEADARQAYRLSGTAHIFSVSGSHVAIITWLVLLLIGSRPSASAMMCAVAVIALYTMLAGAEPPAVRSALMGIAVLTGSRRERDIRPLNMLLVSVLVIASFDPLACINAGFGLSVAATLALIIVLPVCRQCLHRLVVRRHRGLRPLLDAVSVSWAATLGVTIPASALFGAVSLTSPLANMLVVPLMSMALILGVLVALPLSLLSDAAAWWLTLFIRSADASARFWAVDLTSGLDAADVLWLGIAYSAALAWPLASGTWKGFVVRLGLAISSVAALLTVLHGIPARNPQPVIVERRGGIVIEHAAGGSAPVLILLGTRPGPVDLQLMHWARSRRAGHVVGLGPWGRRMKGAILHDTDTTLRR